VFPGDRVADGARDPRAALTGRQSTLSVTDAGATAVMPSESMTHWMKWHLWSTAERFSTNG